MQIILSSLTFLFSQLFNTCLAHLMSWGEISGLRERRRRGSHDRMAVAEAGAPLVRWASGRAAQEGGRGAGLPEVGQV